MEAAGEERLALTRRSLFGGAGTIALGGGLLATPAVLASAANAETGGRTPTPQGFRKYLVYMQNGVIDPSSPAPDTGEFFQTEVMQRSPAEIEADRQAAIAYFRQRFRLDFSGGDTDGPASFGPFMDARRNNYRAYTVSGENVPRRRLVRRRRRLDGPDRQRDDTSRQLRRRRRTGGPGG